MATNWLIKDKWSYRNMNISIVVLSIIVLLTIWMYFFNSKLNNDLESLKTELNEINDDIKTLEKDSKIIIYNMLEKNKDKIELYEKMSKIPTFISNIDNLSRSYGISFNTFSYNSWKLSTLASARNDWRSLATKKVIDFMSYFRDEENENIFKLDFVNNFSWQEEIRFNAIFEIK